MLQQGFVRLFLQLLLVDIDSLQRVAQRASDDEDDAQQSLHGDGGVVDVGPHECLGGRGGVRLPGCSSSSLPICCARDCSCTGSADRSSPPRTVR